MNSQELQATLSFLLKKIEKETIKDFYIEETRAHVLKCLFNNVESEIAVYEDTEKSSFDTIKLLSWNSLQLPTQPLTQALKFYKLISQKSQTSMNDYSSA